MFFLPVKIHLSSFYLLPRKFYCVIAARIKSSHRTSTGAGHVLMGLPHIYGSPLQRGESEPYPGGRLSTLRLSGCGQEHSFQYHQVHLICPQTVRCCMLGLRSCATPLGTYFPEGNLDNFFFFFLRAYLLVLAPLPETSDGMGTIRPSRFRCRRFGRDSCSASRVASLFNILGLGYTRGKSPGFRKIPGVHPLPPCTHVRFGCKPDFSARRGYTYISLFLHRPPRYDPAAQQQSSPLAAAACNSMPLWLLLY